MKGVWFVLKIHIVQKGDTLWEISKKYGVDFEELKSMNSQLSSPDMIMPGMKIKVPGSTKTVKKETQAVKEMKEESVQQPYKDTSPKPMPVIKEDDTKVQKAVEPQMPIPSLPQMPQMPTMEQDIHNYNTMINFQQAPQMKAPVKEKPMKEKPVKKEVQKEVKKEVKKEEIKPQKPIYQPIEQPVQQPIYHHAVPCPPVVPIYVHPCPPPHWHHHHHVPCPPVHPCEGHMPPFAPSYAFPVQDEPDCGCRGSSTGIMPFETYQPLNYDYHNSYREQGEASNLYPPKFEVNQNENDFYPKPPTFPNFTGLHQKNITEEDKEE